MKRVMVNEHTPHGSKAWTAQVREETEDYICVRPEGPLRFLRRWRWISKDNGWQVVSEIKPSRNSDYVESIAKPPTFTHTTTTVKEVKK